jgi:hypothetical protein
MPMREHELESRHREKAARNRAAKGDTKLICECADLRCNATFIATVGDYAKRSRGAAGFWVRPGHQMASFEYVVEENQDYAVVQRFVATPAQVVSSRFAAAR